MSPKSNGTKRKREEADTGVTNGKKKFVQDARKSFRPGLFEVDQLKSYKTSYAESQPYKHGVIQNLIAEELLTTVREEIIENVSFTPKETDIYKIHQSGDLANLDGLDDSALTRLPSLLELRDAMYSKEFRNYISSITGSGPLSGKKTDMAINVYTPGCHLLCHDDVIGTRRVSYILYLTSPTKPWQSSWGGALRLYPTTIVKDGNISAKLPSPEFTVVIPPSFNQLSFFAVQPGESFHDVEEVYGRKDPDEAPDEDRVRMAISGWFHIPQEGEEGFEEGLEEKLQEESSLSQLQGKADTFDEPKRHIEEYAAPASAEFTDEDLEFLLKYIHPSYLVPDTLDSLSEEFVSESSIRVDGFLNEAVSKELAEYIEANEKTEQKAWRTARPPHKHRYRFLQGKDDSVLGRLLNELLPSEAFRNWLSVATSLTLTGCDAVARRFRRGQDYTLATTAGSDTRLEVTIGLTRCPDWVVDEEEEENEPKGAELGGFEVYMAADEPEAGPSTADPAIYKSSNAEDDAILFSTPPAWNSLSIVLRDAGILKFVKYISQQASGDRWDISGEWSVELSGEEEGDEEQEEEQQQLEQEQELEHE